MNDDAVDTGLMIINEPQDGWLVYFQGHVVSRQPSYEDAVRRADWEWRMRRFHEEVGKPTPGSLGGLICEERRLVSIHFPTGDELWATAKREGVILGRDYGFEADDQGWCRVSAWGLLAIHYLEGGRNAPVLTQYWEDFRAAFRERRDFSATLEGRVFPEIHQRVRLPFAWAYQFNAGFQGDPFEDRIGYWYAYDTGRELCDRIRSEQEKWKELL